MAALVVVAVGLGTVLSSVGSSDTVSPNVSLPKAGESREMQDIRRERLQEVAFRPSAPGGLGII